MANSITGLPSGVEGLSSSRLDEDKKAQKSLGQDAFLELMITQLKNQDPTNPMENGEFLSQMAQFGTVSGINELKDSFASLATSLKSNQALQASTLVGRQVEIESPKLRLPEKESATFGFVLENPTPAVKIEIQDAAGQTVRSMNQGDLVGGKFGLNAGTHEATWDGMSSAGKRLAPGSYTVKVTSIEGDAPTAATTLMRATVDSVSLPRNGQPPVLNLSEYGSLDLDAIRRVM